MPGAIMAGSRIQRLVQQGFRRSRAIVKFGAVAGTNVQVQSDTQLTVTVPAQKAIPVDVTVTTGAGGAATFLYLPGLGIKGNSHMLMMDKNNIQIADLIMGWLGPAIEIAAKK